MPLHEDNETIVTERIYLDKADPDLLHDDMTVIDHALTRPWTVAKKYRREKVARPIWPEDICTDHNGLIFIGNDHVLRERRRPADAVEKGPAAAGPALFQLAEALTGSPKSHWGTQHGPPQRLRRSGGGGSNARDARRRLGLR